MPIATSSIPQATAQEWLSTSYVEALVAQAGLNIKSCRWDDGVDLEIGSNKKLPGLPALLNFYLSVQLKSTKNWTVTNDHIHYPLKAKNYDLLRDPDTHLPQFLFLYLLPESRTKWIEHLEECSVFQHAAYFVSLKNSPELVPRRNGRPRAAKTVHIPVSNRLTAASLLGLFKSELSTAVAAR